ncbi:unnamed protein product [Boreogadus saida]
MVMALLPRCIFNKKTCSSWTSRILESVLIVCPFLLSRVRTPKTQRFDFESEQKQKKSDLEILRAYEHIQQQRDTTELGVSPPP